MFRDTPAHYSPPSGGYTMTYPSDWKKADTDTLPFAFGDGLAVTAPKGSIVVATEIGGLPAGDAQSALKRRMQQFARATNGAVASTFGDTSDSFENGVTAYEFRISALGPDGNPRQGRVIAALPDGSSTLYMFAWVCMEARCAVEEKDFDDVLAGVRFATPS